MASVFLSYDHQDADRAAAIASTLQDRGHSVWWDRHIRGGAQYNNAIEGALERADAVLVLWSHLSVQSAWVRDEAAAGREAGKLVPATLDGTQPPMGFRQYQTIDLSGWKRGRLVPRLEELDHAIEAVAGDEREPEAQGLIGRTPAAPLIARAPLVFVVTAAAAIGAMVVSIYLWRPWHDPSTVPLVAVLAADARDESRALARDLMVKLGALQASNADALTLVEQDVSSNPDLVFEVDGSVRAQSSEANLVLLNGRDRSLLWSKDFQQPLAKQSDLQQQLAFTAAKVLECALEAHGKEQARVDQQTLKLYLNGCAAHAELTGGDPRSLVPLFKDVTVRAPSFEGGWSKLLDVQIEIATNPNFPDRRETERQLRAEIAAARKVNPDLAAAYIAESLLVPPTDSRRRIRIIEQAVKQNPANPDVRRIYSILLMHVGRMEDAVDQARWAVQLDPLSPWVREGLISSLAYAGKTEAGFEELSKAERLWPGASSLLGARYRLHFRYGDPHEALRLERLGAVARPSPDGELFLRARIDPSPAKVEKAISELQAKLVRDPDAIGSLTQALAEFGREEELFDLLLSWTHSEQVNYITGVIFRPTFRNAHRDPRMIRVAQRIGLLDYWRETGDWPDFCFRPDLPYDCNAEAAKIAI